MKSLAKRIIPGSVIRLYRDYRKQRGDWRAIREYENSRVLPPPEAFKRRLVKEYGRRYGANILVETGTFHGEMVHACIGSFRQIVSIELDRELAAKARHRFGQQKHIHILEGDSGAVLPDILNRINEPALFWLDGHYSGTGTAKGEHETPIEAELAALDNHAIKRHVILIDDARCFGTGDYPSVDCLIETLRRYYPCSKIEIRDDILRCVPPQGYAGHSS